jgi:hypothetical protein
MELLEVLAAVEGRGLDLPVLLVRALVEEPATGIMAAEAEVHLPTEKHVLPRFVEATVVPGKKVP